MLATDSYPRMSLVGFFTEAEELDRLIESQDTTYARPPQTHNDYFVPVTDLSISDSSVAGKIGFGEFRVIKSALLHENGLDVSISKLDGQLPETNEDYFVELNVTALTEKAADRYLQIAEKRYHLDRAWHILQPASILLVDEWKQHRLAISASVLTSAFIHPVFTISSSEGGFERTYQGTCILLRFEPRALCDGIQIEIRAEDL